MKASRRTIAAVALIVAVLMFLGCGVSKEDHEKTVAELNKTRVELDQARAKIAEMSAKPAALLEEELRAAREKVNDLAATLENMTLENAALKERVENLNELISEYREKLKGLEEKAGRAISDILEKR